MPRSAFTLMEMILVLVLMTAALGFVVPYVDGLLHPNQVAAARDTVRGMLEEARSRSMELGVAYRFSVQDGGGKFRIEADDESAPNSAVEGDLPEPCLFVESVEAFPAAGATPTSNGVWRSVAVFVPTGESQEDATLVFGRPGLPPVVLRLRALTGTISEAKAGGQP